MKPSNSSVKTFSKAITFDNGLKNLSAFQLWHLLKQNIRDPYCITDEEGVLVEVNDHFCHTLEYQEKELLERNVTDLLPAEIRPYALMLHHEYIWEQSEENDAEWVYLTKSGNKVDFRCHSTRLLVSDGKRYKLDTFTVSQPTDKPADHEDLVKKMQHQFKNTLHEINGLLHLQAVQTQGEVHEAIMLSQTRVAAIAVAYELLYRSLQTGQIELSAYLAKLAEKYRKNFEIHNEHPTLYWPVDKAYALGIMLTEFLISGKGNTSGESKLTIEGEQVGQQYHLRVLKDENFTVTLSGFSRQLINALANQLRAKIQLEQTKQEVFSITCPL